MTRHYSEVHDLYITGDTLTVPRLDERKVFYYKLNKCFPSHCVVIAMPDFHSPYSTVESIVNIIPMFVIVLHQHSFCELIVTQKVCHIIGIRVITQCSKVHLCGSFRHVAYLLFCVLWL